tara:strand:+ start:743 stop:1789 length:1047 start_codon:yes stop_codon:yes gene_type:complete
MVKFLKDLTYKMPAEWEKQKSTWIAWPHNKTDWPNKFRFIPDVFGKIISKISKVQKINILIENKEKKEKIILFLRNYEINFRNVSFSVCKTDRVWVRDSFPIFVKNKVNKKILLNWKFNAWAKYKNFKYDNGICQKIKKKLNLKDVKPTIKNKRIVLEGGSIDVNGKGTLLTTLECLHSKVQERNPGFKRKDYENIFKKFLGVGNVIWLNKGIAGDDTHGHVDDIARFVDEKKIFIASENNKRDINHKPLKENYQIVNKFNKKNKFKIIKIPMPSAKFIQGVRVPASYLNFYIANKLVLVPTFKDRKDKNVIKIFKKHFKNRNVVPIDCSKLIWGFGAVHCMTQQEPI